MIKAIQLLFVPGQAWAKIVASRRGVLGNLLWDLLPLLLLSAVAEGAALLHGGDSQGQFGGHVAFTAPLIWRLEIIQILMGLIMVVAGAKLIRWISESFHLYPSYAHCFLVAAYGLSPVFIMRFLNCIPGMNPWITWALGAAGCIFVLYQGVGIVLQPEPTKGFGLYVLIAFTFSLLTAMSHLIALMVLQGKLPL